MVILDGKYAVSCNRLCFTLYEIKKGSDGEQEFINPTYHGSTKELLKSISKRGMKGKDINSLKTLENRLKKLEESMDKYQDILVKDLRADFEATMNKGENADD